MNVYNTEQITFGSFKIVSHLYDLLFMSLAYVDVSNTFWKNGQATLELIANYKGS